MASSLAGRSKTLHHRRYLFRKIRKGLSQLLHRAGRPPDYEIQAYYYNNCGITSAACHSEQSSVILSKAKNPALGGETLRFAQGDKGVAQDGKGQFRNFLNVRSFLNDCLNQDFQDSWIFRMIFQSCPFFNPANPDSDNAGPNPAPAVATARLRGLGRGCGRRPRLRRHTAAGRRWAGPRPAPRRRAPGRLPGRNGPR